MVKGGRHPSLIVRLQAGPAEVNTGGLLDVNLRISDRSSRAFARQLAAIGDQLDREWTNRRLNRLPPPLHMLRPAQTLTRTMYRDFHNQFGGFKSLSAAVKAWVASTAPWHGLLRAEVWTAWLSSFKPITCTDWTRGALVTVALVAAVTLLGALWMEWKD